MKKVIIIFCLLVSSVVYADGKMFIPKTSQELPDNYGITIFYITGLKEDFEIASHRLDVEGKLLEFVTKDDIWYWVPMTNVLKINFDKRFSKIIAIKEKLGNEAKTN